MLHSQAKSNIFSHNLKLIESVGFNIREIRQRFGETQQVFAEKIGVSRAVLGKIETNGSKPSLEVLLNVSARYNISVDDILGVKNKISSTQIDNHSYTTIKMYDIQAGAGSFALPIDTNDCQTVYMPPENFSYPSQVHIGIRVKGYSMAPSFMSGDSIICRSVKINELSIGLAYVFVTDEGSVLKRLKHIDTQSRSFVIRGDNETDHEQRYLEASSLHQTYKVELRITTEVGQK